MREQKKTSRLSLVPIENIFSLSHDGPVFRNSYEFFIAESLEKIVFFVGIIVGHVLPDKFFGGNVEYIGDGQMQFRRGRPSWQNLWLWQ
jgi:hypothetical protein